MLNSDVFTTCCKLCSKLHVVNCCKLWWRCVLLHMMKMCVWERVCVFSTMCRKLLTYKHTQTQTQAQRSWCAHRSYVCCKLCNKLHVVNVLVDSMRRMRTRWVVCGCSMRRIGGLKLLVHEELKVACTSSLRPHTLRPHALVAPTRKPYLHH